MIDNINKNMTRRHHSIELVNHMFNGTMRAAMLMPSNTEDEIARMRTVQGQGVSRQTILPGAVDFASIKEGFLVQAAEMFSYLRGDQFTKRPCTPSKLQWRPLEIVQRDSKYVEQMVDILDELQVDGAIRGVTP